MKKVEEVVLETKADINEKVIIPNLDEEKDDVVVSDFKYEDTLFGLDEMLFDFKSVVNPSENILVCIQHVECIQKLLQKENEKNERLLKSEEMLKNKKRNL